MEGQSGERGQNPFHFNHSVIQISTYGVGEWSLMKQNESQGCLMPSYVPPPYNLSGVGGSSEEETKRDKISNKNHHRNHDHTIVFNKIHM